MLLPIVDPCQGLLLPLLTTIHNQILLIIFFSSKKQWIFLSPYCSYQPDWLWQSLWADSTVIPSTTSPVVLHLPWLKLYNPKWSLKPLFWSILTPHYSPWWKWELSSLSMTSVPLADFSCRLSPAKGNYHVGWWELLVVVLVLSPPVDWILL